MPSPTRWSSAPRVSDLFGDRILIEDATGRILVELGASTARPATLEAGQYVEVEGRLRGRTIEARRVALAEPLPPGAVQPSVPDAPGGSRRSAGAPCRPRGPTAPPMP
jgi:hypothetical protein